MSSQLEAMTQRQDRVERLMSSAPQASSKEPPAHKQDFPLVGKGSPRPSALKFVSRVGSPPRSRPLADANPEPRKTVEFTNVDEPLALPSDPDYPGGEQSVPVLPQPEALSAALFQQSQALTTLVAHLAGQDGMEFGSTGTSSALSLKGSLKRDKLLRDLAERRGNFFLKVASGASGHQSPSLRRSLLLEDVPSSRSTWKEAVATLAKETWASLCGCSARWRTHS